MLKAKAAREALRNDATAAKLGAKYQLYPNQISAWKKQLLDGAAAIYSGRTDNERAGRPRLESSTPRSVS